MLNSCVKAVDLVGNSLGLSRKLSAKTTSCQKYLTSQAFFMSILPTAFNRLSLAAPQPIIATFNPLFGFLSPLTTGPINTNKLINL